MDSWLRSLAVSTARNTIAAERDTLDVLHGTIGEHFCDLIAHLYDFKGRVVITGIGKSAIVAQKIVATLNSTGTPSLFMHAADAIHGDLGMIRPDDVVICLSKSGETPEIRALAPILSRLGNVFVAIVANPHSTLAQKAHFVLETPIEREADPLNLAPTSSTAAQMALGDAIATALIAVRGFSSGDFANYHPGGALGKQLLLKVADICATHEQPAVTPDTPIRQVIVEISGKRLGATAVLTTDGQLVGIVTDGDLRRMLEKEDDFLHLAAADIMTANPKTIDCEALATEALQLMRNHNIGQLIAMQGDRYVGMVHIQDLLQQGLF